MQAPSRRPQISEILSSQWINHQNITLDCSPSAAAPKTTTSSKQPKKTLWFSRKRTIHSNRHNIEANQPNTPQLFNTNRANSVLDENFLHPIEVSLAKPDEPTKAMETYKKTRSRSIFSNSLKKRIEPFDDTNRNRSQSNSNECRSDEPNKVLNSVANGDEQIDALRRTVETSSKQNSISCVDDGNENANEEQGDFFMAPTNTDDITLLHTFEIESRSILDKLGISSDMLIRSINSGPRSEVIGAYRIVVHRLQQKKILAAQRVVVEADVQPQRTQKTKQKCTIL